jgi:threonine/homoserine/homoserine lactone efflux protein
MDPSIVLKGLVLGLSIAAPVGPIGLLCIRRTLRSGMASGFASGLGAATADTLFGCVAAAGLAAVSGFLVQQQTPLRLVGGAFLCYLGASTALSRPALTEPKMTVAGLARDYVSTLGYTLTNPMTIIVFTALLATVGSVASRGDAAALILGVFLGSGLWWLFLSTLVSLVRTRLRPVHLLWVNRVAGAAIAVFGVVTVAGALA